MYDAIIVGAGVAGLSLAHYFARDGKKVLVLEGSSSVGGCNKVYRGQDNLFSEHAPRVCFTSYLTFDDILHDMNTSLKQMYGTYKFDAASTTGAFKSLSFANISALAFAMLRITFQPNYGSDISVRQFMHDHHFSAAAKETFERFCLLIDGAGSDRLSMAELLFILQNSILYSGLQPKNPTDVGLFALWTTFLHSLGVEIECNAKLVSLIGGDRSVTQLVFENGQVMNVDAHTKVIIASAPINLCSILKMSPTVQDAFGDFDTLNKYAIATNYLDYVTFTLHWFDQKTVLPPEWGFPRGEWGVGFINMTATTKSIVLSCALVYSDKKSEFTGKTANECLSTTEIMSEAWRQIGFAGVAPPDAMVFCPDLYRQDEKWKTRQHAYVISVNQEKHVGPASKLQNLFSVGTHNGRHTYLLTSMESAISNSLALAHDFDVGTKFRARTSLTIWMILRVSTGLVAILIAHLALCRRKVKSRTHSMAIK